MQDPYDLETPPKAFLSNDGRYLLQVFDGRYRVYDTATGLKLLDRAGRDPNFSPTSRFIAAQIAPNANAASYGETEVIDLTSREVIARVLGPFIGLDSG